MKYYYRIIQSRKNILTDKNLLIGVINMEKTLGNTLKPYDDLQYYEVTDHNPLMVKLRVSDKKKLYHYTTSESGKNILKGSSFWVTRCDNLADITEIKYISHVLDGVIMYIEKNKELYIVNAKDKYIIVDAIIMTLKALRDLYKKGAPITDGKLYLLSLSENKSNKYLIETYCGKDGVILEFKNDIDELFIKDNGIVTSFTAKVEYGYNKQMRLIIEDINDFFNEFHVNLLNNGIINYIEMVETIRTVIYVKVINYSFFFKHENFSKEEEYRVAFLVDDNNNMVKYRMKSGKPISYYEAKIKDKHLITRKFI